MVLRTISLLFDTFIKTFSWKSLTKNKVKGHIYPKASPLPPAPIPDHCKIGGLLAVCFAVGAHLGGLEGAWVVI